MPELTNQNRIYLSMPKPFEEDVSGVNDLHTERSEYPAPVCVLPCCMQVSVTFDNLADYSLIGDVHDTDEANNVGRFERKVQRTSGERDRKITVMKRLTISEGVVPGTEYPMLRSLLLGYGEEPLIFECRAGK